MHLNYLIGTPEALYGGPDPGDDPTTNAVLGAAYVLLGLAEHLPAELVEHKLAGALALLNTAQRTFVQEHVAACMDLIPGRDPSRELLGRLAQRVTLAESIGNRT